MLWRVLPSPLAKTPAGLPSMLWRVLPSPLAKTPPCPNSRGRLVFLSLTGQESSRPQSQKRRIEQSDREVRPGVRQQVAQGYGRNACMRAEIQPPCWIWPLVSTVRPTPIAQTSTDSRHQAASRDSAARSQSVDRRSHTAETR